VRAANGNGAHSAADKSQHLTALVERRPRLLEMYQFLMGCRNGGGINDQIDLRQACHLFRIANLHPLRRQFPAEGCFCAVITHHTHAFAVEITRQSAHADTADADKVDTFYVLQFHRLSVVCVVTPDLSSDPRSLL